MEINKTIHAHDKYFKVWDMPKSENKKEPSRSALRRQREKEQRYASLLESAEALIVKNGYHKTSVGQIADALELTKKTSGKGSGLPDSVTPPMPAIVIAILAKPGDEVEKGQGIIVVSAMKMETTISSPYNGKIISINTAEGEKVNPGDILADIEKDETIKEE